MATHTGSAGLVKVGSNTAAEIRSFTLDTSAEVLEDTTLGDTSRTYQIGKKGATVSVECWWDETDTNGQIAMAEGSQVALNLYPEGADSGDKYFVGTAIVTGADVGVTMDGIISRTFTFQFTGGITEATV